MVVDRYFAARRMVRGALHVALSERFMSTERSVTRGSASLPTDLAHDSPSRRLEQGLGERRAGQRSRMRRA